MKWFPRLLFSRLLLMIVLTPFAAFGQGVKMSADFLPLAIGNRWVYQVTDEQGKKIGDVDFSVRDHTILEGRSFYVLTGFPFVPQSSPPVQLLRYDRDSRAFVRMIDNEEDPLFLSDAATTEVLEVDAAGLPQTFIMQSGSLALIFKRGVGIIEARIQTSTGVQTAKISNVRIGQGPGGAGNASPAAALAANIPDAPLPKTPEQKTREAAQNVTSASATNPIIDVDAVSSPDGDKLVMVVRNTSDKLLPFRFNSGESYDFAITDPVTGVEIWRWSRRMFFSQVIRSEAIRAKGNWRFEVEWNHRDNDLNPVLPGHYRLVGIISSIPPIQSDPITIDVK